MTDNELLPCPFCGGEAHARQALMWDEDYNTVAVPGRWTVNCDTEGCMGEVGCAFFKTEGQAIEAWNTRAEQAVAATLGAGECECTDTLSWEGEAWSTYYEHWLSCGHVVTSTYKEPPKFCEECGKKVKR